MVWHDYIIVHNKSAGISNLGIVHNYVFLVAFLCCTIVLEPYLGFETFAGDWFPTPNNYIRLVSI